MSLNPSAPWHRASFDLFIQDRLPQLLADRLPLVNYQTQPTGRHTCQVVVTLASASGDIETTYADLPQPDEDGAFDIDGKPKIVVPNASTEELDVAEIHCVGEQLYDHVAERLGKAPANGLPWDAELARAWLPLDSWISEFLNDTAQILDTTNWLARHTHLRRLIVPEREKLIAPGQAGRVCPFETPEGFNIGRVFTIAVGAEIREGKLVIVDGRPEAGLGLSASMIPLLEHNDANLLLMGANMMRQWIVQSKPEPALVQTGHEPDMPDFWTGRNLLTAFISWGPDTTWDGIVISKSCAQRFDTPYPLEPGDKMGNRHGTKGVVSRILPDDEMPHLPDGTPVDLVFSFIGLHVRINFGQVREAVLGRIARAKGTPIITPPFHAPSQDELCEHLAQAGLPKSGMETLTLGRGGPALQRPSTVGWVYWGRLVHLARNKVMVSTSPRERAQMQGDLENHALRDMGAYENLHEYLNTRSIRREGADTLAARVAAGPIEQAGPPTPMFSDIVNRLRVAGIEASLEADQLTFRFAPPGPPKEDVIKLAQPVPHPWLHERQLTEIGAYLTPDAPDGRPFWLPKDPTPSPLEEYARLVEANDRLARMLSSQTPKRLVRDAVTQLETRVNAFFDVLLTPKHLRFRERQLFSGRAVIVPGADLRIDQVGLGNEIAWTLFGPLVIRELENENIVHARSEQAAQVLDEVMAHSWVVVNRAPTLSPTALIAFHPVRDPASVIRLHPLVCEWLDADFDGDQVAVFLPVTEQAQREAGERLSVAGHLARDPGLVKALLPPPDALWGLASLGLTEDGRREIAQMVGAEVVGPGGLITQASLAETMRKTLEREGINGTLLALERLMRRGLEFAKASGASMSPFIGKSLRRPPEPGADDADLWAAYGEELTEKLVSMTDYTDTEIGPQLLAVSIRALGQQHLPALIGPKVGVIDARDEHVVVPHGYTEGLTSGEMLACAASARRGLARWRIRWEQMGQEMRDAQHEPGRFTVLARARRAQRPGIVFARAAATGEVDPLANVDSRLLIGLPIAES